MVIIPQLETPHRIAVGKSSRSNRVFRGVAGELETAPVEAYDASDISQHACSRAAFLPAVPHPQAHALAPSPGIQHKIASLDTGKVYAERVMKAVSKDVTTLLRQVNAGDPDALGELIPLLYKDLRRMAAYYLGQERRDHTLQPTALVHEAYLRLVDQKDVHWQNQEQVFGIAAQLMRRILVDYARRHHASKRGGTMAKVSLDQAIIVSRDATEDMLVLDETLTRLAEIDPQQARVVELRVFGGLTVEEAAELLGISRATVKRDWSMAKAWLMLELRKVSSREA